METKSKKTWRATHPGTILKYELEERGITQKAFAKMIGMQVSHVSELLNGKRDLTKTGANKIEKELGISATSLMNIQAKYEYDTKVINERLDKKQSTSPKIELYNEILEIKAKLDLLLVRYEKLMQSEVK